MAKRKQIEKKMKKKKKKQNRKERKIPLLPVDANSLRP